MALDSITFRMFIVSSEITGDAYRILFLQALSLFRWLRKMSMKSMFARESSLAL
jgi:hypothetical protein